MRSDIVFDALQSENQNRFVLCHQAFKAIRLLHKNKTRIEDTANDAIMRIAASERQEGLIEPEDAVAPAQPSS